ncbi:hypothetical protein [Paenarthrobacter sp. Z7-10]|uniref:hypothetical protein n=1 Tax=Paenarthrobacter sp. Z7-10 TaxID=2787635 RepID=UPI0022A90106|nr:hypothetical protein [Paenarthrobacter sp. Z7-10]
MPIEKSVFLPVDPDAAFALITEPERLRRWQTVAALRAGPPSVSSMRDSATKRPSGTPKDGTITSTAW